MKVVLVEWRAAKSVQQWGTLGIQYIASSLRKEGFEVKVQLFEGISIEKAGQIVSSEAPDILGISYFAEIKEQIYELTALIKEQEKRIKIFTGGHTASLYPAKILLQNTNIDIVCRGEGELTVLEMCKIIRKKENLSRCDGIFYREKGVLFKTNDRELVENLDMLEHPVLDLLEESGAKNNPNLFVSVSTSRGCLGRCVFCVEHRVSQKNGIAEWRGRSPEHILDELIKIKERFPKKRLIVRFVDGAFEDPDPLDKKRLRKLMNLLEEKNFELSFSFLTRAESWKIEDLDLIQQMRRLGLFSVSIGFESGSADTLKALGKRATLMDNHLACGLFEGAGVFVYAFIMMFQPYSTLEDLRNTGEFLNQRNFAVRPEHWGHAMYIYPDTVIYRKAAKDGLITGVDETGFMYRYAFCNSEVQQVYEVIEHIQNMEGTKRFQLNIDKIMQEQEFVNIWIVRDKEVEKIREVSETFNQKVKRISDLAGNTQYRLFMDIIKEAQNGNLQRMKDELETEWSSALLEYSQELEYLYFNYKVKIGRMHVRTI